MALLVVISAWIAIATLSGEELWTSLTAIGTLGAVLLSALCSASALINEHLSGAARERERHKQEILGQAEQIWWWIEECPEHPSLFAKDRWSGANPSHEECWGVCLVLENRSDFPISEVRILSSDYLLPFIESTFFTSLGPASKRVYHLVSEGASLLYTPRLPGTRVVFQDRHNQMWERAESGAPTSRSETAFELMKFAEEIEREQRLAIQESHEFDWVDRLETDLRTAVKTSALESQISHFDEQMFKVLQQLERPHWRRRVAEHWWKWRSGQVDHALP